MNKVFVSVGISLDGYIAGLNGGPKNPLGDDGKEIHKWLFNQKAFQEHLHLENKEGETGKNNKFIEGIFNRIGANIMGKNMFIEGEASWPDDAPFHCPVYVLTHQKRDPWERPGGTTFYFVQENIYSVLEEAKNVAGQKDVRISGGANIIQQYLNAGLVDELLLSLAPVLLGNGVRLFDNIDKKKFSLEITDTIASPQVTHLIYNVIKMNG